MRDQTLAIEFHFWPIDQLTSSWRRPLARLALKSCTLCYNGILNFADVKCLSALNGVEQLALRNQPLLVKSKLWPQLCRAVVPSVKTINDSTTVESKVVDVLQDLLQVTILDDVLCNHNCRSIFPLFSRADGYVAGRANGC
eukprot:TRINITY_DN9231_c0_g1_i1.p4 TRINITY_DN9231_c0_g1~~TRINITY_DN9231_c0_g1_i1.p4  ORF type:complete len:141 (+),score=15.19 TRINITY_DN9231_c0_g1_i1:1621-2043(+)